MGRELSPKFEFDEKSLCERVTENNNNNNNKRLFRLNYYTIVTRLVVFVYNIDRKRTIPENYTFCLPWQWEALVKVVCSTQQT